MSRSAPSSPAQPPLSGVKSRRRSGARATAVAFLVSGLVHAAAIALYPRLFGPPPARPRTAAPTPRSRPRGMQVVRIVELTSDVSAVERPVDAPRPEEPQAPDVEPLELGVPATGSDVEAIEVYGAEPLSAAERLRPWRLDPRLWPVLPSEVTDVSMEQLARLRILWAIEDAADSAQAARAAAQDALDWTYTDGDGGKWGISPGQLHLGGITIPLPFFGAPYGSLAAERSSIDAEINRAAGAAVAHETLKERARAIRERKDRERAKARGQPPDTTRVGG